MKNQEQDAQAFLLRLASEAMLERGFQPEFAPEVLAELQSLSAELPPVSEALRDDRHRLWCSIDNDDSRDLDQLTAAEVLDGGSIRIFVAVADVAGTVRRDGAIDRHAQHNTTSVYTAPRTFPMLPERLCTDLTSLNPDVDRTAYVVEAVVDAAGEILEEGVHRAIVRNRAQLAYPGVGAWLQGEGPVPERLSAVPGLAESVQAQDRVAQALKTRRQEDGALDFASLEVKASMKEGVVESLQRQTHDRAKDLIEHFMITANGVIARFLGAHSFPVLRRVVRTPERWERIVVLARELDHSLPAHPDSRALRKFLSLRRKEDPLRFPDLSLSIIKLLGRGEYVATRPGRHEEGHFGLAVGDYTHSTAPNRRYPDLITQRLVQAALAGQGIPYAAEELRELAAHCTEKESDAQKVERRLIKSAAALMLEDRWGEEFDGLVTGASDKGTWVRIFEPPVEGRVEKGARGLDVGDQVRVRLLGTNPQLGYIDFERLRPGSAPPRRQRHR